jgi:hypothetical protein
MKTEIFSIPCQQFTVFRQEDGSMIWIGNFRGMKVAAAMPLDSEYRTRHANHSTRDAKE